MRVLIYEYFSGGGLTNGSQSSSMLCEGLGMLKNLILDFKARGHFVITILDKRIINSGSIIINADKTIPISSLTKLEDIIFKQCDNLDAAYVIAPETNKILQKILTIIINSGITSLNCSINGIKKVSNKIILDNFFKKNNIMSPKTIDFNISDDLSVIKNRIRDNFSFPLIIKPAEGTGCEGISIIPNYGKIKEAILKIKRQTSSKIFLVQDFIEGINVSVSLLSANNKAKAISLNRQDLIVSEPDSSSEYMGGFVPFFTRFKNKAFFITEKILDSIKDLNGYVGIDLIITNKEIYIIEINPRLTTSFIGLRKVININLAQALVDCFFKNKIPTKIENHGYSYFSKIKLPILVSNLINHNKLTREIIIPPILTSNETTKLALIAVKGSTKSKTYKKFNKIKKELLQTKGEKGF